MSNNESAMLIQQLHKDEEVLWTGKPISSYDIKKNVSIFNFIIVFIFLLLSICVYFSYLFSLSIASDIYLFSNKAIFIITVFVTIILMIILSGVYKLLPNFKFFNSSKIIYSLTNKRAIIINYEKDLYIKTFLPNEIENYNIIFLPNGSGDIVFSCEVYKDVDGNKNLDKIGFLRIKNVKEVEKLIIKNLLK